MKKYLLLLYLHIKLALKSIPKLFAATFIFSFFILVIAFSANEFLYKDKAISKINIALVAPEENIITQTAFSILLNMDSIKETCNFQFMDRESALNKLEKKEVYAVILIPEHFVENILNGTNTPAHVLLLKDSGIESMIFKLFADSGSTILSSAQSGIYAVSDLFLLNEMNDSISTMENELNYSYLTHAINRTIYFSTTLVSATGELSVIEYYLASGFVLVGLLSGISCYHILKKDSSSLKLLLEIRKIPYFWLVLCKLISTCLIYFFIILIGLIIMGFTLTLYKVMIIFFLILSIISMILCVFQITDHGSTGIMILFLFSVTMIFISGGFIPSTFLPEQITTLAKYLPTTFWIKQVGYLITNSLRNISVFKTLGLTLCFLCLSIGFNILDEHKETLKNR